MKITDVYIFEDKITYSLMETMRPSDQGSTDRIMVEPDNC